MLCVDLPVHRMVETGSGGVVDVMGQHRPDLPGVLVGDCHDDLAQGQASVERAYPRLLRCRLFRGDGLGAGRCASRAPNASRLSSRRSSTCPAPSIAHPENTCFAKSTPRVIVLMETSSSADGCVATPSWPSMPQGRKSLFTHSRRMAAPPLDSSVKPARNVWRH